MATSVVYSIIDFSEVDASKIQTGSYLIGFDLNNANLLSKIDHSGVITVIEGGGGSQGPAGPQGPQGPIGPTGEDALNYERRSDFSDPFLYCGSAEIGASESSSIWKIIRITINSSGSTLSESANNVAWTNRYTLIYT